MKNNASNGNACSVGEEVGSQPDACPHPVTSGSRSPGTRLDRGADRRSADRGEGDGALGKEDCSMRG